MREKGEHEKERQLAGGTGGKSQIKRRREILVLYNRLNNLWRRVYEEPLRERLQCMFFYAVHFSWRFKPLEKSKEYVIENNLYKKQYSANMHCVFFWRCDFSC